MRHRFHTQPHRTSHDGQVIILFALRSLVLVGALALAIDVGFLLAERRQVQAAADAGVLAAAHSNLMYLPDTAMVAAGKNYGAENAGVNEDDVQVNRPPTSGRFAGNNDYVEVTITKEVQRFFLGAVYTGDWSVTASAVAVVELDDVNVALLALNPDSGGINTSGSTWIETIGGSVVSNYNIDGSGNTTIKSDEHINANDGILRSGTVNTFAGKGVNESAAEVPDPLAGEISPPLLPASPGNIVPTVNPPGEACYEAPKWYVADGNYEYTGRPGRFSGGGGNCVNVQGVSGGTFTFPDDDYRFEGGAGVSLPYRWVLMDGGTWNFNGGPGISVNGSTDSFEMRGGSYSFTNGANLSISGNAPDNILGGDFYFNGGGGIVSSGTNHITLNPGTYVFDGGPGLSMSGNVRLHFNAGNYEFWFLNGADMKFSGGSYISRDPGAYAKMYFYDTGSNTGDLEMSGNTDMGIPSGQYYFDRGRFLASGSSKVSGNNVFLYFKNGGYLKSNGMSGFAFTAPTTNIYTGYYPGVFLYSDAANTAEFEWTGYTSGISKGIVYLPSSKVVMSGYSNDKVFEGQFIADSFQMSGNNRTVIEFHEYVETAVPNVYLVD